MIVLLKIEDGQYTRIINTEQIVYSFKRDTGYGLLMENKQEVWLTYKEFNQLVDLIAKKEDDK